MCRINGNIRTYRDALRKQDSTTWGYASAINRGDRTAAPTGTDERVGLLEVIGDWNTKTTTSQQRAVACRGPSRQLRWE